MEDMFSYSSLSFIVSVVLHFITILTPWNKWNGFMLPGDSTSDSVQGRCNVFTSSLTLGFIFACSALLIFGYRMYTSSQYGVLFLNGSLLLTFALQAAAVAQSYNLTDCGNESSPYMLIFAAIFTGVSLLWEYYKSVHLATPNGRFNSIP